MSISYVDSVATLPRPTAQQVAEFVEYVAMAHSWYKHLPLLPPGRPFMFYLDPNAGREWIQNGSLSRFRDRLETTPTYERFHYTWQPTSDYVARFGYLTYFVAAGTSFRIPMRNGVLVTALAQRIQVENRRGIVVSRSWITVPEDVRREGTVYLTAVIHVLAQRLWHLHFVYGPSEIGGSEKYDSMLRDILAYDDSTADEIARTAIGLLRRVFPYWGQGETLLEVEEELKSRALPAWAQMQKQQMSQAIHRMLDYIYARQVSHPLSNEDAAGGPPFHLSRP